MCVRSSIEKGESKKKNTAMTKSRGIVVFNTVSLKMWFPDQQYQNHLGIYWKCKQMYWIKNSGFRTRPKICPHMFLMHVQVSEPLIMEGGQRQVCKDYWDWIACQMLIQKPRKSLVIRKREENSSRRRSRSIESNVVGRSSEMEVTFDFRESYFR